MLDRSRADAASPRARALAFALAACIDLAVAAWLAYAGFDSITGGCGCYDPIRDEAVGAVLLVIAVVLATIGIALALRAFRVVRPKADS